jgi:hypothetical protein
MTVDDFIADLSELGQELSDPQQILTEIGSDITEEMRRRVPVDTGALKQSIGYTVNSNQIEFKMLYYGFFQNYGVSGQSDSLGRTVPFGLLAPSNGSFYQFKKRAFGLPAQQFFNYDTITNEITDGIADFTADF